MGEQVFGLDVSNWQGNFNGVQLQAMRDAGVQHVVVRLSLERDSLREIARQQLTALRDAGIGISGYVWVYFTEDPAAVALDALGTYDDLLPARYWLDVEDTQYVGTPSHNELWLHRCIQTFEDAGFTPGIYTGAWYWKPYLGNTSAFQHYPLWTAEYDDKPDLTAWTPYGGWTSLAAKQFQGSGTGRLAGMAVDLDVFDAAFIQPRENELSATEKEELAFLRSWHGLTTHEYPDILEGQVQAARQADPKPVKTDNWKLRQEAYKQVENVVATLRRGGQ